MRCVLFVVTVLLGCGGELSSSNGQPDASDDVTLDADEDTGPEGDVSPGDDTQEDADLLGLDSDADDPEVAEDLAVPQATTWFGLTSGAGQLSSENYQLIVHLATPQPMAAQGSSDHYTVWLGLGAPQAH